MTRLTKTLLIALSVATFACDDNGPTVQGNGPVVTRTLDLDNVRGLAVSGSMDVVVAQGPTQEVTVAGHKPTSSIFSPPG